jgi:3-oxoacyl-[acyl-carrier-protein] synthase III
VKLSTEIRAEQGSAIVDLIGFGIMLQIPILMFATLAVQTQQESFAVEAIARHGLRAHVLWPDRESTSKVISELVKDFGISPNRVEWIIYCRPDPSCLLPKTMAEIEVRLGALVAYSSQRL